MKILRLIGAIAALLSGVIHGWEWLFNGYGDPSLVSPVIGTAFLVNFVAGVVIAILLLALRIPDRQRSSDSQPTSALLAWRNWLPMLLLFGLGVVTLGSFVATTTVGMFGDHETWTGALVWIAAVAEAVAIVVPLIYGPRAVRSLRSSAAG
jgi:hypothetical protein